MSRFEASFLALNHRMRDSIPLTPSLQSTLLEEFVWFVSCQYGYCNNIPRAYFECNSSFSSGTAASIVRRCDSGWRLRRLFHLSVYSMINIFKCWTHAARRIGWPGLEQTIVLVGTCIATFTGSPLAQVTRQIAVQRGSSGQAASGRSALHCTTAHVNHGQ